MNYTSEHDLPFYSDPSYDRSGHYLPCDYEPEPDPIYCNVCGDESVDVAGAMCAFCASTAQVAERAEFDAWRAAQTEARAVMATMRDALTISRTELLQLAHLSDELHEREAA